MTRRAKERRVERVQEKQRALDERAQREAQLSRRSSWRALLLQIDGSDAAAQAVVSPRHQQSSAPIKSAAPPIVAIADAIQWKTTNVAIAASSTLQLPINVAAPRATLQYAFTTRDFDITFGIQAVCADGQLVELAAPQRYESHLEAVRGHVEVTGPAMVLLLWDNSFSWLNTKQLAYTVELKQHFPQSGLDAAACGTPEQRASLAAHERVKREKLRLHHETSLDTLQTLLHGHDQQLDLIKSQLEELRKSLQKTEALKDATIQEQKDVEQEIDTLVWEMDALLWRSMGTSVIHKVFEFCSTRELTAWSLTNHQWHQRVALFRGEEKQEQEEQEEVTK